MLDSQPHPDYDDDDDNTDWNPEAYYSDVEESSRLVTSQTSVRKKNKINFWLCTIALFLSNAGFGIVSPSLWNYIKHVGGTPTFLGVVVSLFGAGHVIGALILGYIASIKKYKIPLSFSLFLIVIGGFLYGASFNMWFILLSRIIQGFGSGNSSIIQSYVASITEVEHRPAALSTLNLIGTLGFVFGPLIGAGLSFVHVELGPVKIYSYSAPGYFCALAALMALIMILIFFREQPRRLVIDEGGSLSIITPSEMHTPTSLKIILWILIAVYFTVFTELAVFDTLATPITVEHYGWGVLENCLLWAGIATVSLVSFFSVSIQARFKFITDGIILNWSLLVQLVGLMIIVQWPSTPSLWRYNVTCVSNSFFRFLLGTFLISWGFPISQTYAIKTFSKLLGDQKQSVWMGLFTASGAAARMAGPLWSAITYERTRMYVIFGILAGLLAANFAACAILFAGGFIRTQLETSRFQKMTGRR